MRIFHSVSYVVQEANKRKLFTYASSCSFYLFLSLVPLSMICCCLLKYTPLTEAAMLAYIEQLFSESVATLFRRIVTATYSTGGTALTISILMALYSASACIRALMKGLDAAYDFIRQENYVKYVMRAILYLILFVLLIFFSLGVMGFGHKIVQIIGRHIPVLAGISSLFSHTRFFITAIPVFIFLLLIYTLVPAERIKMSEQIPGALFSTIIWILFSLIFSGYLAISDKYGAFGLIGTAMVAMLWFYYSILILLVGGFLNSFFCYTYHHKSSWNMPFPEELFDHRRR